MHHAINLSIDCSLNFYKTRPARTSKLLSYSSSSILLWTIYINYFFNVELMGSSIAARTTFGISNNSPIWVRIFNSCWVILPYWPFDVNCFSIKLLLGKFVDLNYSRLDIEFMSFNYNALFGCIRLDLRAYSVEFSRRFSVNKVFVSLWEITFNHFPVVFTYFSPGINFGSHKVLDPVPMFWKSTPKSFNRAWMFS